MPTPVSSTQNVKIGVCNITLGGTDLGYTKGGVEVEVTTDTHKVNIDQFGNTPVSEYIMGRTIMVTAPLAETTLDNLATIMPGTLIEGTTDRKASVNVGIGTNLRDVAVELRLHPIGVTGDSEDLVIPLAATPGALKFAYKLDDERVFNVQFMGYPDDTGLLFYIGTATPV